MPDAIPLWPHITWQTTAIMGRAKSCPACNFGGGGLVPLTIPGAHPLFIISCGYCGYRGEKAESLAEAVAHWNGLK